MKQSGIPGSVWQLRCDTPKQQQQIILKTPGHACTPKSIEMPAGPAIRPHLTGALPPHMPPPHMAQGAFVNIVLKPAATQVRPDVIPRHRPGHHGAVRRDGSGGGGAGGRRVMCDLCREERKRRKGEYSRKHQLDQIYLFGPW